MPATTMISVAPTGAETAKSDAPALPVTLDEPVRTAAAGAGIGATVVHVHVRDAGAQPTLDVGLLKETVAALREATDLVVQLSTGGAVSDPEADRLRVLEAEPDAASCVLIDRWEFIVELHTAMRDRQIVPEYEIVDHGQLATLQRLLDRHGPPYRGAA